MTPDVSFLKMCRVDAGGWIVELAGIYALMTILLRRIVVTASIGSARQSEK